MAPIDPLPPLEAQSGHRTRLGLDVASLLRRRPEILQASVVVRVIGDDPKQLKCTGSAFFDHMNGRTCLSCSGVLIRIPEMRDSPVVICSGYALLPFMQTSTANNNGTPAPQILARTHLLPRTSVTIVSEAFPSTVAVQCELVALGNVPAVAEAIGKLIVSNSEWTIGFTDQRHSSVNQFAPSSALFAVLAIPESSSSSSPAIPFVRLPSSFPRLIRGEPIFSVSSPFALLCEAAFSNSVCAGYIANIAETNGASIGLTDLRCLPGSEGGAVYNANGQLIGLLSLPLRRKNAADPEKQVRFGLLVPIEAILRWMNSHFKRSFKSPYSLVSNCGGIKEVQDLVARSITERAARSLVPARIGDSWASSILLLQSGYVLTNAHLLRPFLHWNKSAAITDRPCLKEPVFIRISQHNYLHSPHNKAAAAAVKWKKAELVFCSKGPWDIALLKILEMDNGDLAGISADENCISLANKPELGEAVIVLGFALFRPAQRDRDAIFSRGTLAKIVHNRRRRADRHEQPVVDDVVMLQSNAVVHRGNSGGMLLNRFGNLLGMVTCNAKYSLPSPPPASSSSLNSMDEKQTTLVYPSLNFSIPAQALRPLFSFIRSQDKRFLKEIDEADEDVHRIWALQFRSQHSAVSLAEPNPKIMDELMEMRLGRLPEHVRNKIIKATGEGKICHIPLSYSI